ncbi:transglutaminase domain-containing protein [Paenibacillus sp. MWE-103]|uniref:Transglutaminase domain-containing protein n=2 Tax=Paenibacillus artemisiicola TaxID=1172618 RepID=A0ABS3WH78_9BACL|nr:transglutaminase-like domain-containing protein [Paenibacillus artemisiicola]MBO7747491.1 transglutaminase domain-containing protein [Paenibacillus artemisiicola]
MTQPSAFSLDDAAKTRIERKFREKRAIAQAREEALFGVFRDALTDEESWALKYLYAYMPVIDMADYDGTLFLNHVRTTLEIRGRMPWGARVPDRLFLAFVLPYRVNTENIEDSRGALHAELAGRTSALSMADAILETNYWCHEKATYVGSDLRTLSPLGMLRNARGRCGEESTLAVAALRSIGIPARQVYTPRWAHCDDNHAWVEAWADGTWHYFGACEPEARLDQGWFGPPARRAMLVNTRIAGDYPGSEDVTLADAWYTEINLLPNYAPTRTLTVAAKDGQGEAARGAQVRFELYNMAEFFPIAALPTDERGEARLTTGYGDLLVRAAKGELWGETFASAGDGRVELVLDRREQPAGAVDADLTPPPELAGDPPAPLSEEAAERHRRRLEEGTRIRAAYEASFPGEAEAAELAAAAGLPAERVGDALRKARGNAREIAAFLREQAAVHGEWPLRLLESLNEKDLTDTFSPALADHLLGAMPYREAFPEDVFVRYVLCPRVLHEMIVPYRGLFAGAFGDEEAAAFRAAPAALARWLGERFGLWEADVPNLQGRGNPAGSFRLMRGDRVSRDVLFAALCRALGIPARLHPSELKPQYWTNGRWADALYGDGTDGTDGAAGKAANGGGEIGDGANRDQACGGEADARSARGGTPSSAAGASGRGTVRLLRDPAAAPDAPEAAYAENFTVARLANGAYVTLLDPLGAAGVYDAPFEAEPGAYRLTTGVRMKDGAVKARLTYFAVRAGEETAVTLSYRRAAEALPVLGALPADRPFALADGTIRKLGELAGRKGALVAWLEPEREPTKHLLRELGELAAPYAALGAPIVLAAGGAEPAAAFDAAAYPELPASAAVVRDAGPADWAGVSPRPSRDAGYPHLFVVDERLRVRYASSGYRIGTGKEALRLLNAIASFAISNGGENA